MTDVAMPPIPQFLQRNQGTTTMNANKKSHEEHQPQEAAQQAEVERAESVIALARETMKGDLRDHLLDLFKNRQKSWQEMGEWEQREVVGTLESSISHAIDKAVRIIAADGRDTIVATVEQVTVKDGIKAVVTMSKSDPTRHALFNAQGLDVLLVVASGDAYHGAANDAEIDADQRPLPLDEQGQEDGDGMEQDAA